MKKLNIILSSLVFGLCANLFAVSIGETVKYQRNNDRTSWIIKGASGALTVVEESSLFGPGYILKLDYFLDVMLRGQQSGDIGIFVPAAMLDKVFYPELAKVTEKSFGVFSIAHKGYEDATDANGRKYGQCDIINADNVDHHYNPNANAADKAKIVWFNHQGSITSVSNLKLSFKAHPSVAVLGAVEIDIAGVSNNGVSFKVGLDANIQ